LKFNDPAKILVWLQKKPAADELRNAFPAEWDAIEQELASAIGERDPARLHRLLTPPSAPGNRSLGKRDKAQLAQQAIKQRMAALAMENYSLAIATGKTSGRIRFNLFNGLPAQWLLFKKGLERKPVSMFWFRLLWPLIWQKRYLMPLVESKGIYCFYSAPLVSELVRLVGGRTCLEIGAGDGTLTGFLRDCGADVTATDDFSWSHKIQYPPCVVRMDARSALRKYKPQVAICSWPPAQNTFEAEVFRTPSVELYVAILSRFRFASGNWDDYESQKAFSIERAPDLSRLVLPPELGSEVVVFRRRSPVA
jgi:hypothetical protein